MEIDIDLVVLLEADCHAALVSALPAQYVAVGQKNLHNTQSRLSIRYLDDCALKVSTTASALVVDFLRGLDPCVDLVRLARGELRLGIYYSLNDTVVFPLHLDSSCIRMMADLNLSLDSTGYAYAEGEGQNGASP